MLPAKVVRSGFLMALPALLAAQSGPYPEEVGRKALDLLLAEKYPELSGMFSDNFKQTVTLAFLQQRVSAELKEFGKPQNIGKAVFGTDGPNSLVSFPVQFSNTSIHVQFTLNRSRQIAGIFFRPPRQAVAVHVEAAAIQQAGVVPRSRCDCRRRHVETGRHSHGPGSEGQSSRHRPGAWARAERPR